MVQVEVNIVQVVFNQVVRQSFINRMTFNSSDRPIVPPDFHYLSRLLLFQSTLIVLVDLFVSIDHNFSNGL